MARSNNRSLVHSFRVQILVTLLLGVLFPTLVRLDFQLASAQTPFYLNMLIWTTLAAFGGLLLYRRVLAVPGAGPGYLILPTYTASYLVVILVLFFFRLDYSRTILALSYFLLVSWMMFSVFVLRPKKLLQFAVVPGGRVERLKGIPTATWNYLRSPDEPLSACDGVIVDLRIDLSDRWARFIADATLAGTPVFHVKEIEESLTGQVEIEHLSENNLGSLNPNEAYLELKIIVDWLLAALSLVVLLPVFLLVALAIKLDSPGEVMFRQSRQGYRQKPFRIFKFRTMMTDPPGLAVDNGGSGDEGNHAEIDRAITRPGDNRITRVGRFLRRTRLDELPQILNILRGEMSWIGPRPEATVLSAWYDAELPFYSYRHIVRPGITGWAQVNQGHVADVNDVHKKLHYDFYYIKNFSFWLDVTIFFMTIKVILSGHGSK
ncbi:polyprenyl glycosylphosphotransferase [Nitratireductor sp. CAU 1489]|uniref:Polyprenyl glycosylphosphotransferase n=1 Tax=Nitratireductor arenosus TaxID=2682096 RepID=A0A844QLI6_9HYPH|nr:sugar transferase [Nitratireductor arenosus]MVB00166.1 polyprenyl glycosylphosphotransferase [Nitratireductor arenosus]